MSTTDSFGREYSERPWGSYTVLDDTASNYKVKQITVTPGKRLSYQTHKFRSEHWFIVSGHATVVLDGATIELDAGGSVEVITVKVKGPMPPGAGTVRVTGWPASPVLLAGSASGLTVTLTSAGAETWANLSVTV